MRCANCDWPLSPSRTNTNCPKCGAPTGAKQKAEISSRQQGFEGPSWNNTAGSMGSGGMLQDSSWDQSQAAHYPPFAAPTQPSNIGGNPENWPGTPQASFQAQQEIRQSMPDSGMWNSGASMHYGNPTVPGPLVGAAPSQRRQVRGSGNSSNIRLGFTAAALCVIAGGLLLVFVFFLATSASGNPSSSVGSVNTQHTSISPTSQPPSLSPTTASSPTATSFPGQQYISNAQMASQINTKTAQPTQLSTTFMVNQKIYVTFQLHPAGQSGAVCLLWYLNGRQVTGYNFAVGQYSSDSYSYAIYGGAGTGTVEVYWASSTSCADKQLAQRVNFTVTQ
jgi:hypothetical protein